jgi:hypothetical protein
MSMVLVYFTILLAQWPDGCRPTSVDTDPGRDDLAEAVLSV